MSTNVKVHLGWPASPAATSVTHVRVRPTSPGAPAAVGRLAFEFRSWATGGRWEVHEPRVDAESEPDGTGFTVPLGPLLAENPWLAGRRVAMRATVRTPGGRRVASSVRHVRFPDQPQLGTISDDWDIPRELVLERV